MACDVRRNLRALAAAETNLCPTARKRGGHLSVCLVYPNRYHTGMSSLGFQSAYALFSAAPGVTCERAFLPERDELAEYRRSGQALMSLESQRPLSDFDVVAFSTSFEPDYLNIPLILSLARIPLYAAERDISHPLLFGGGAAFFINPEPVAPLFDAICIGDGEDVIPGICTLLCSPDQGGRDHLLRSLAFLPAVYVPGLHTADKDDRGLADIPLPVVRSCADPARHPPAATQVLTERTEFGDMYLVEVSRGCPRGCRFCSSGFGFGAFRQYPCDRLLASIDEGLRYRDKIGLVGAAVSDYREIGTLCSHVVARGGKVSVSSLRIDRLDDLLLDALVSSGHKTVSLAPEGGSQRLRDLIRKNLNEEQILAACERIAARNILNLKLYFIMGLPTETDTDLDELVRLTLAIRERVIGQARGHGRLGEITLSINPFVPKPFTPFQWCAMATTEELQRKQRLLEQRLRGVANLRLKFESPREAYLQALLSRGDRGLAPLIVAMAAGASLKQAARACDIDTDRYALRGFGRHEALPWEIISSADRSLLEREYDRAFGREASA